MSVHFCHGQNWFSNNADSADQHIFSKNGFLQVRYQRGGFMPSGDSGVQYIEKNPFDAIDVRYGLIGYGRKKWHQLHHYPTFGLGVTNFFFHPNNNLLGNPFATYLFFNEPLVQFKKSKLAYDFDVGLSYGWKPYDPQTNPNQQAIGSSLNFIFMLGLQYEFKLSNRLEGSIGANLNHMSNGRIRSPNRGINQYAGNVSLRYRLAPLKSRRQSNDLSFSEPINIHHDIDPFKSMLEFYAVGSAGVATTFKNKDNHIYYLVASITTDVARHYRYNAKFGAGLDLFYDVSLKEDYQLQYPYGNVPSRLFYWPGVHLSHEYMVHHWTLVTQAGLNLWVPKNKGVWYARVGLRYDVSKSIFLRASVRLYQKGYSDFIEWGVGYSYYKFKR
ncbi:MAG: acyloxyacyl hydrolase [Chryseolinea sp.]